MIDIYTLEKLKEENPTNFYLVDESILSKVNNFLNMFAPTDKIKVGDCVEYTDEMGRFYPQAHIENVFYDDDEIYICEHASTHVSNGYVSTSGGVWHRIPKDLKKIGTTMRSFWTWGSAGPKGGGGIYFKAEVSLWEYDINTEPYSTKNRDLKRMTYRPQKGCDDYVWLSDGIAFKNDDDLIEYLYINRAYISEDIRNKSFIAFIWKTKNEFHEDSKAYNECPGEDATERSGSDFRKMKRFYDEEKEIIVQNWVKYQDDRSCHYGINSKRIKTYIPQGEKDKFQKILNEVKNGK